MKPSQILILAAAVALGAGATLLWQNQQGPAESFGESIDEGAEELRDEIDDAT